MNFHDANPHGQDYKLRFAFEGTTDALNLRKFAVSVDHYTYRVTWSSDDGEHVGLCAEFPSLSWLASTPEGALKGIRKIVADVVADMQKTGEKAPEPITNIGSELS